MSSEEEVFREAIRLEPDDHVHRHVYADWLLDHDPERAPLVRRQAELGPSVRTSLGRKLVPIPGGTFQMGSPAREVGRDPDEMLHEVTLSRPFYLGATPVTVGEFRAFVGETGHETQAERTAGVFWVAEEGHWQRTAGSGWRNMGWKQGDDEPVVGLEHGDALAFCAWLGARDGREYRLPTEAEWEYACRAGTTTPYSFGQVLTEAQANFAPRQQDGRLHSTDWKRRTTPVGVYPANGWGLFDMHGNAWEWCWDWYDMNYYARAKKADPHGARGGMGRVLRGGSWYDGPLDCRSALRRCGNPYASRYLDGNTGFRLAMSGTRPPGRRGKRAAPEQAGG